MFKPLCILYNMPTVELTWNIRFECKIIAIVTEAMNTEFCVRYNIVWHWWKRIFFVGIYFVTFFMFKSIFLNEPNQTNGNNMSIWKLVWILTVHNHISQRCGYRYKYQSHLKIKWNCNQQIAHLAIFDSCWFNDQENQS